jgi:hypothetical protein
MNNVRIIIFSFVITTLIVFGCNFFDVGKHNLFLLNGMVKQCKQKNLSVFHRDIAPFIVAQFEEKGYIDVYQYNSIKRALYQCIK